MPSTPPLPLPTAPLRDGQCTIRWTVGQEEEQITLNAPAWVDHQWLAQRLFYLAKRMGVDDG